MITNNVIHSNRAYGIHVAGYPFDEAKAAGREYADAKNWLISNNTIAFNENRSAICIWQSDARNCTIQNNIFYDNSQRQGTINGIDFVHSGDGHIVRHNISWSGTSKPIISDTEGHSSWTDGGQNVTVDPLLVDPERHDFRPQPQSPAIGKGHADGSREHDHEGKQRDNEPDIGAFERG